MEISTFTKNKYNPTVHSYTVSEINPTVFSGLYSQVKCIQSCSLIVAYLTTLIFWTRHFKTLSFLDTLQEKYKDLLIQNYLHIYKMKAAQTDKVTKPFIKPF